MTNDLPGTLRIVHCFRAPVGGLFRHVVDLAGEQADLGHEVGIVCDSTTGGQLGEDMLDALKPKLKLGITRFPISRMPGLGDLSAAMRVRAVMREIQPDVVHGHGAKGGMYARMWPLPSRTGTATSAYTPHGGSLNYKPGSMQNRVYMGLEGWLAQRTGVLLFESAYGLDVFRDRCGEPPCLAKVVHNGVRDSDFEPIPLDEDATDFLHLGELREAKGLDVLVDSFLRLADRGVSPTLTLVGSGPDEAALRAQAAPLGEQIRFVPAEPAKRAFARGRNVVMSSRKESLPYVALEAAALARPLIATNVGGMTEIFADLTDRLVPADDPEALAEAIARCFKCSAKAQADADALKTRIAEHFTVHAMTESILSGYREGAARA
ncbi:glycosyltransferase family 4 protein [Tepidamorphus sp. 3E244]|uniref:glycosyltransferase family 4 protein n=1 Tax=Tepidamorphus sp. 3E244 TaxID=3385498 RepID=UPI0038FD2A30